MSETRRRRLTWQIPVFRALSWVALQILGPFRTFGSGRVPKRGALIVLANHLSDADPVALQAGCPRHLVAMADHELWEMPGVKKLLDFFGAIPVKRGAADRGAIREAASVLERGGALSLYPEGMISASGELLPLMPGVTLLHRMSGATLICAGLTNTNRIRPYVEPDSGLPKRTLRSGKLVQVRWGEPRDFPPDAKPEEILGWIEAELRRLTLPT